MEQKLGQEHRKAYESIFTKFWLVNPEAIQNFCFSVSAFIQCFLITILHIVLSWWNSYSLSTQFDCS